MCAGAMITIVVLTASAAMLFNILEQRPQYIADWLGQQIGRDVSLRAIELSWNDGAPLLRLNGLKVQAEGLHSGGLALEQSEIRFDALSSLRSGSPQLSRITVLGADIRLRRDENRQWLVAGLGTQGRYRADDVIGQTLAAIPKGTEFSLQDASLSIEDVLESDPRNSHLKLSPVNLNLYSGQSTSRLSGAIGLPGMNKKPVRFILRWSESAGSPIQASKLALIVNHLPLTRIPWAGGLVDIDAIDGVLGLRLDIGIQNGAITTAAGSVELQKLALSLKHEWPAIQLDALTSAVDFAMLPKGWRLSLLKLAVENKQHVWPLTTLSMTRIVDKQRRHERLALDQLPVSALTALLQHLPVPEKIQNHLLVGLKETGQLENIELTRVEESVGQYATSMSLDFSDLAYHDQNSGINVDTAKGSITMLGRGGRVQIESSRFVLPENSAQAQALSIHASGDLRWHHASDQLVLDLESLKISDQTLSLDTQGTIQLPTATQKASLQLHARVSDVNTDQIQPYLDSGLVSPEVGIWITQSLRGGRFTNLHADIKGQFNELDTLSELISIGGNFQNVNMDYAKGWPQLKRLDGELSLAAKRLSFHIRKGDVAGARIENATGIITDVSNADPVIRVKGKVLGRSEHAATFISASPLKSEFSGLLNNLELSGPATLGLELDIPLSDDPLVVRGTLHMRDNDIQVPALHTGLSKVLGQISFDTDGPKQGQFEAQYLDRPIQLGLDGSVDNNSITRLTINGRTNPSGLARHLYNVGAINSNKIAAMPLFTRLSGQTQWHVELDIPFQWTADTQLALLVESNLQGIALDLPAPLGKAKSEQRLLRVKTHISEQPVRSFDISYGQKIKAILEVKPDGPRYRLSRGEIRLDSREAKLPTNDGLQVSGSLPYLSVDDWITLVSQYKSAEPDSTVTPRVRPMADVRTVRLDVESLDALGSNFNKIMMDVTHSQDTGWKINLDGQGVEGRIEFREPLAKTGIQAHLNRLEIQPNNSSSTTADIDPRDLPPLNLIVDKLSYKDLNLGLLKLILKPYEDGTYIEQLFALSDAFEIRGHGNWLRQDDVTRSALKLQVNGNDFGQLLSTIGYADTGIDGGAVDLLIDGQWPGSPIEFETNNLQGTMHFRASKGYLRDVEPGMTGRMFGLLNLTVLPRRLLQLDFSDLYEEGLGYNLLEGSFNLESGNAYTNNLKMETDNSRIEIEGRVGLILQDYDQVMTVTPKLSSSLPLAPLWLAEKFLNTNLINDAFSYRYTITGNWDAPEVERIPVKLPEFELELQK